MCSMPAALEFGGGKGTRYSIGRKGSVERPISKHDSRAQLELVYFQERARLSASR
jgi:hypothetical protein